MEIDGKVCANLCMVVQKHLRVRQESGRGVISSNLHMRTTSALSSSSATKLSGRGAKAEATLRGVEPADRGEADPDGQVLAEPVLWFGYTENLTEQNGSWPSRLLAAEDLLERGERLRLRRTLTWTLMAGLLLSASSSDAQILHKKKKKVNRSTSAANTAEPDKILYNRAAEDIRRGRQEVGRLGLQTLINTYPDSEFLAKAKLH